MVLPGCHQPTINAPPFNTMDFYGNSDITTLISDDRQVRAFFFPFQRSKTP